MITGQLPEVATVWHKSFAGKDSIKKLAAIALIIAIFGTGCTYEARETRFGKAGTLFRPKSRPQEAEAETISQLSNTTDVHFSAEYCAECHFEIPPKRGSKSLR